VPYSCDRLRVPPSAPGGPPVDSPEHRTDPRGAAVELPSCSLILALLQQPAPHDGIGQTLVCAPQPGRYLFENAQENHRSGGRATTAELLEMIAVQLEELTVGQRTHRRRGRSRIEQADFPEEASGLEAAEQHVVSLRLTLHV
jgi:hypothetical protein